MIFYHMTLYQIWYCFKTCDIESYFVILYHIIPYCIISHDTISYYDTISYPNHLGILIGAYVQLNYLNEKLADTDRRNLGYSLASSLVNSPPRYPLLIFFSTQAPVEQLAKKRPISLPKRILIVLKCSINLSWLRKLTYIECRDVPSPS